MEHKTIVIIFLGVITMFAIGNFVVMTALFKTMMEVVQTVMKNNTIISNIMEKKANGN